MIISASRRTDIPAFFSEWFFRRIEERYVLVRNPFNRKQVSRVSLDPSLVDCIVFWTKNPGPMLPELDRLRDYKYYFHFTLNPYGKDIEKNVPAKKGLLDTFRRLADTIGPERVIWRYDPIILSGNIGMDHHREYFAKMASYLSGYTHRCYVGAIDMYRKTVRNVTDPSVRPPDSGETEELYRYLSETAKCYGISVYSCTEETDLSDLGIIKGKCVDEDLIRTLTGKILKTCKDPNQRPRCQCVQSIDIGEYATCGHFCNYCYANPDASAVQRRLGQYNANSPLLCGHLGPDDVVTERKVRSLVSGNDLFKHSK